MRESSALMMFTFILLHSMPIMKCNNTEAKHHKGFFDDCIHKRKLTLSFHPSGSDQFKKETLKLGFVKS